MTPLVNTLAFVFIVYGSIAGVLAAVRWVRERQERRAFRRRQESE